MTAEGVANEEIARYAVELRNQQKVVARSYMKPEDVQVLEIRNMKRYNNPIGPTADDLFNKIKESLITKGTYISDNQVWQEVIQKSMIKDDVINTLLGIIHLEE